MRPESIDCARATGALWTWSTLKVGKGDRKTRRGKIYRGSFGKSRPKDPAKAKKKTSSAAKSTTSTSRK
jgi:30S ribosomal protein S31